MAPLWAVLYKQPSPFLAHSFEWVPAAFFASKPAAERAKRKGGRVSRWGGR